MVMINLNFDLTSYYLSLFRICHNGYELGNYISGVYNSRKPVAHEGTKRNLMSVKSCCHFSHPLLSEDISTTVHSIETLSFCVDVSSSPVRTEEKPTRSH